MDYETSIVSVPHTMEIASGERTLVRVRDFTVPAGKITFLFGESGIGKSLIARALYGLLDPDELAINIDGRAYREYLQQPTTRRVREQGFFVFQEPSTHLNPLLTLGAQLTEGSLACAPEDTPVLERLWEHTDPRGLRALLNVYPKPHRPSGGEKQRFLLAMAFKKIDLLLARGEDRDDALFVFDEPTGSLDNHFRDVFLSMLLERYQKRPFTVLLITHDYSMVGELTRHYGHLLDRMVFVELAARNGHLSLHNFLPETYLRWLKIQTPEAGVQRGVAPRPRLVVQSGIKLFGRAHLFSSDPGGMKEVPLVVHPGTMVYVKAPSGTGKTSIMKAIMGLLPAGHLSMVLDGVQITERTPRHFWQRSVWGRAMTMVFQHADEALNPESTVRESFRGLPVSGLNREVAVLDLLRSLFGDEVTPVFLRKKVKHLSGGQKQRLNLLRSLALDTGILITDEPLNGLDFESMTNVLTMLRRKQQEGKGIIMISHNEEILDTQVRPENVYYLSAK